MGLTAKAKQWRYDVASDYANRVIVDLAPFAARVVPVGSLRRCDAWIGDIDLQLELTGNPQRQLPKLKKWMQKRGRWVRGADRLMVIDDLYGERGLKLELSIVYPPRNWFAMLAIRTGPALLERQLRAGLHERGFARPYGELPCEDEEELFTMAGVDYVRPELR